VRSDGSQSLSWAPCAYKSAMPPELCLFESLKGFILLILPAPLLPSMTTTINTHSLLVQYLPTSSLGILHSTHSDSEILFPSPPLTSMAKSGQCHAPPETMLYLLNKLPLSQYNNQLICLYLIRPGPLQGRENSQFLSEIFKRFSGKRLGKDISHLVFGGNILQFHLLLKHLFS
jgi:hypothetical protein